MNPADLASWTADRFRDWLGDATLADHGEDADARIRAFLADEEVRADMAGFGFAPGEVEAHLRATWRVFTATAG